MKMASGDKGGLNCIVSKEKSRKSHKKKRLIQGAWGGFEKNNATQIQKIKEGGGKIYVSGRITGEGPKSKFRENNIEHIRKG